MNYNYKFFLNIIYREIKFFYPCIVKYEQDVIDISMLYKNYINAEDMENFKYMSREETINLVRGFLDTIDKEFVNIFDKVDIFMATPEEVEKMYRDEMVDIEIKWRLEDFSESIAHMYKLSDDKFAVNILESNTIKDVFILVHEFMHIISYYQSEIYSNLVEVNPIFSELVLSDYLKKAKIDPKEIDKYWICRNKDTMPNKNFIELGTFLSAMRLIKEKKNY